MRPVNGRANPALVQAVDVYKRQLFHYAGDDVAVAYNSIIDRIMNHGKIPSFAVRYRGQLSDSCLLYTSRCV